MKKIAIMVLALALLLTGFAYAENTEEKLLRVYTWTDYIDAETIAGFTAETGIAVEYVSFASNEEMFLKLQANGASEYDIVLASDYVLSMARKEGLLLELDKALLTNYENLNPAYLGQYYDPDSAYTIPYSVGSPMIVYNPDMVEGEITSFDDLWDPQFKDSLCLLDDARVMIAAVLKTLGYSYNTTDEAQLAEAKEKLFALKENVRVLDYDTAYTYVLSGEVAAAYLFTPFVLIAQMENPNLVAVFSEEGIGYGIDSLVIPANAPHPTNAHLFLDYLMRPEVAAHVAEWQLYINPNQASEAQVDPALQAFAALNIPADLLETAEFIMDVGAYESVYQDIWMEFKLQ
jgi:spermidine/putrescine transport system substrate-binding protein